MKMKKGILATILFLSAFLVNAQKAFELGGGLSVYQFNRMPVSFTQLEDGSQSFRSTVLHAAFAGHLYAAKELNEDGTFALAGLVNLGGMDKKFFGHFGVDLQWRPFKEFKYIQPYVAAGLGYMYKGSQITYFGRIRDVEYDIWNRNNASGEDAKHMVIGSLKVGVNHWFCDKLGYGIEVAHNQVFKNYVANPLQGTVKLMYRFGGKSKKPTPETIVKTVYESVEVIKTDTIVQVVEKEVEKRVTINKLLTSITFEFNKWVIPERHNQILDYVAEYMKADTDKRYLLSGHTDTIGDSDYNDWLSLQRVDAIKNALSDRGVPDSMIKTRGNGSRIAQMPASASDDVRDFDRKVTLEEVTDIDQWNAL